LQAARLCQECAEVGARPTHWRCHVLLNALCKSLTCKFSISISISVHCRKALACHSDTVPTRCAVHCSGQTAGKGRTGVPLGVLGRGAHYSSHCHHRCSVVHMLLRCGALQGKLRVCARSRAGAWSGCTTLVHHRSAHIPLACVVLQRVLQAQKPTRTRLLACLHSAVGAHSSNMHLPSWYHSKQGLPIPCTRFQQLT